MNLIESIENLINESEDSASKTLDKIKTAIQNAKRPDFSKIKDFLLTSTRYSQLPRVNPEHAEELFEKNRKYAERRYHDILRYGGLEK